MVDRRQNVVRVLLYVADDLEARRYSMAGVLRQLAREVATMESDSGAGDDACRCGAQIVQPRTGRPRKSCFNCSPRKSSGKVQTDGDIVPSIKKGAA